MFYALAQMTIFYFGWNLTTPFLNFTFIVLCPRKSHSSVLFNFTVVMHAMKGLQGILKVVFCSTLKNRIKAQGLQGMMGVLKGGHYVFISIPGTRSRPEGGWQLNCLSVPSEGSILKRELSTNSGD